ncbi:BCS1 N terminal-domain-containing protein [Daldinia caldariorum]|uniref:BCS1 N terminal-domain-containing protein n=1 Tax=Daldinia caldariorum TaxID=326644 RepID=UPI0020087D59|nr:BCS1 N terminal-domain-containing protein [Daldinia caldariorum]KAI1468933.1 BCS1 N terminal-domain-containing protein [Daldinia caldariorum]
MDYGAVFSSLLPGTNGNISDATGNASATGTTQHAKVVESVLALVGLRGMAPIYGFIGGWLGFEPSNLLAVMGVFWALNNLVRQMHWFLQKALTGYFMSSVHIRNDDDIYDHLMDWLATQPRLVNSRNLVAETASKRSWDEDATSVAKDSSGRYLNFSNQEARAPAFFSPAVGVHNFWWRGQYFQLNRKRVSIFEESNMSGQMFRDQEDLEISCFWRSPEPIKQLLAHAKQQYFRDHQARTTVKRPSTTAGRRFAGRVGWYQVASRPIRDIKTVVLDEKQKLQVLADINEYLHPETPKWYSNRGIPLRRGYLFHGPPGTGKTSLSFALAGIFGLDIHVISLLEPSLTEEDLSNLFATLPRRCIVLLEDIDTAGLRRPSLNQFDDGTPQPSAQDSATGGKTTSKSVTNNSGGGNSNNNNNSTSNSNGPRDWKVSDLARALKKEGESDQKNGISLSGLLNAIDGVASQEGRVLIMTTNTPEQLDDALIRPGRVDLQVAFANATRDQARELFLRMYEEDQQEPDLPDLSSPNPPQDNKKKQKKKEKEKTAAKTAVEDHHLDIPVSELPAVAAAFGEKIPDGEFSPATIQGYLLKRKKQPRKALEEADMWVEGLLRQKAMKTKILQVQ